jgi:soluble lytic murein transglycosylase
LLAYLAHDPHYSGGDLEDPLRSVAYGITYLGLLLDRFDGNFPLAVASYNGGPHNVGAWVASNPGAPTDELVEMIPFKETRHYVKVVTSNYATYVALYEPAEAMVRIPDRIAGNHSEIVNF